MALDDIKERLREQALAIASRIQETPVWNQINEKYSDLSPAVQKAVLGIVGFTIAVMLFLVPYSFFASSQNELAEFEDKKTLMRSTFRVAREANALPMTPPQVSASDLHTRVSSAIDGEKPALTTEQKGPVQDFDASKVGDLPKGLTRNGVMINLNKLNLDQIVKIGTRLQGLGPTVKMTSMKISASQPDPHYFDVAFRLVALNLPVEAVKPPPKKGSK